MSPPGRTTGHTAGQAFNTRVKMVTLDLQRSFSDLSLR